MKKLPENFKLYFFIFLLFPFSLSAQVGVNGTNSAPDSSAMLDVQATDKGMLIPRMTSAQRTAISNPATGLLVFDNDNGDFWFYNGSSWEALGADNLGNHTATQNLNLGGYYLSGDGDDEGLFINDVGRVGVGNKNPEAPFDVSGEIMSNQLHIYGPIGATLDQAQQSGNHIGGSGGTDWQSFTAGVTGSLVAVELKRSTGPGGSSGPEKGDPAPLRIYAGEGTNGSLLATSWVPVSTGTQWQTVNLSQGIPVIAGNQYTIAISSSTAKFWLQSLNDTYAGGLSNNNVNRDRQFRTYVSTSQGTLLMTDLQGNVGIGTNSPTASLDVDGQIRMREGVAAGYVPVSDANGVMTWTDPVTLGLEDNLGNHTATQTLNLNGNYLSGDGDAEGVFVDNIGRAGIGTNTPDVPLHVKSSIAGDTTGIELTQAGFNSLIYHNDNGELVLRKLNQTNQLVLGSTGNVGIGTSNPDAPLHVQGTTTISSFSGSNSGGAWMKQSSGAGSDEIDYANNAGSTAVSIYASGSIVADGEGVFVGATVNFSDRRIKQIEGLSNSHEDLNTLQQIEITDYRKIDGGKQEKKLIAQQVREVFPQAVSLREGVIPSIYEHIDSFTYEDGQLIIETEKPHGLTAGDQIDYYTESNKLGKQEVKTVLSNTKFTVTAATAPNELFVFGKWVNDVHVVDYDAVSMLNVSATQEQQRIIEAQQAEIEALKARLIQSEAKNQELRSDFESRLKAVETLLQQEVPGSFSRNSIKN